MVSKINKKKARENAAGKKILKKSITATRKRAKKSQIGPFELLNILIDAVGAEYHKDPTRAGVSTAKSPDGYYLSAVRYQEAYAGRKLVVLKKRGWNFEDTLRLIARRWYELVTPPPVVDLVKKLGAALA